MTEPVTIAVLAKAPIPGLVKTRLIPALGVDGAAALQAQLIRSTVATAMAAAVGPVMLWTAPDETHQLFQSLKKQTGVRLALQPEGDLGARMHAAFGHGRTLVIGCDCPVLNANHLVLAAATLNHHDAVIIPAEDGGYVLIGLREPHEPLFIGIAWSTPTVMQQTRRRLQALALTWREMPPLWDVDTPEDVARLQGEKLLA